MEHYYAYVYVRILQALGAYGFRGFYERKAHFLQSVPYALKNLRWLADNVKLPIALPALLDALEGMSASEKLQGLAASSAGFDGAHLQLFVSPRRCPPMSPATAADLSSMRAACPIPGAKSNSGS